MPSLTIFLDASVILSGLASPGGGSGKLLVAATQKKLTLLTTPRVIEEVVRHLDKLHIAPGDLHQLLSDKIVRLLADPNEETIKKFRRVITDPDDAHVLAGAVTSGAGVLLSLDKKHVLAPNVVKALRPISIQSPKSFWRGLQK
ncbi:MAG: putative toxin-antitoxin system toxin component, PIN family [Candidatus Gottesmanbacteria bacterium]|nr:putative toxin-antitoxin system toxin component, PIN family [Candidatus Gottesmanbacteria bacterium]